MTGPEHYAEAERLTEMYREASNESNREWAMEWGPQVLAAAQVHATLALAAATAVGVRDLAGTPWVEPGQYGSPE